MPRPLTPLQKISLQPLYYGILDLPPKLGLFPYWVSVPDINIVEDFFTDDGDIERQKCNPISFIALVKVALTC